MERSPKGSDGSASAALLEDIVAANRILAMEGVLDAYGHVSIRHPSAPDRYLLSRSLAPASVTGGDILEYDLDSNPLMTKVSPASSNVSFTAKSIRDEPMSTPRYTAILLRLSPVA